MQAWQHNPAQTLGRREGTRRRQQNRPSRKLRRHYQPLAGTTKNSTRGSTCLARAPKLASPAPGRGRKQRQSPPRRHTQPLAGTTSKSTRGRSQRRSQRRRGAAHAAAHRAERRKAFRGHGRQSVTPLNSEPMAGMARVLYLCQPLHLHLHLHLHLCWGQDQCFRRQWETIGWLSHARAALRWRSLV